MDDKGDEEVAPEPFDIGDDEGPWCKCCPRIVGMGFMTAVMAVLGVAFGSIMYESNAHKNWMSCYSSRSEKTSTSWNLEMTPAPTAAGGTTPEPTGQPTFDPTYDGTKPPTAYAIVYDVASSSETSPPGRKSCWLVLVKFPGDIWISALKLLIIPLMSTLMLTLPSKMRDIAPVGLRVLGLLLFTSFCAALQGLIWGNAFSPGKGVETGGSKSVPNYVSSFEQILNIFRLFVPPNIINEMASNKILGVVSFFLLFGIQIENGPRMWSKPIMDVANGILRATIRLLVHLMWYTPIAMFSLVSFYIANTDDLWNVFEALAKYVGTQIFGQFLHLFGFYFLFYFFATGGNPLSYFMKIWKAPATALATSSSAATMPVTIRVNLDAGNDPRLVAFTIPLGAGMNMDGTSLGFPIMVLFTAQLAGITLDAGKQITVAIMAMVCSLGTAPVPNAGLVFLQLLYLAADIDSDDQEAGMALIVAVDWLIDRVETAQNVTSDSFVCGILNHYFRGGSGPLSCCMSGMVTPELLNEAENGGSKDAPKESADTNQPDAVL